MRWLIAQASEPSAVRNVASIVWTAAVTVALVAFVLRDPDSLRAALGLFSPVAILVSALLVLLAKVLLAELFGAVARSEGVPLSLYERQRTYHLSQLAKYLPGFVWQFASKALMLQRQGAHPATTARVIAIEQLWIIGGAMFVGVGAAAGMVATGGGLLAGPTGDIRWVLRAGLVGFAVLSATLLLRRSGRGVSRSHAGLSLAAWLALSLSFAVLVAAASSMEFTSLLVGSAAFPIAYVGGYVVPFAPGGIGVREGLLAALISPILLPEVAVAVAVMSRLVYLAAEVMLSVVLVRSRQDYCGGQGIA